MNSIVCATYRKMEENIVSLDAHIILEEPLKSLVLDEPSIGMCFDSVEDVKVFIDNMQFQRDLVFTHEVQRLTKTRTSDTLSWFVQGQENMFPAFLLILVQNLHKQLIVKHDWLLLGKISSGTFLHSMIFIVMI